MKRANGVFLGMLMSAVVAGCGAAPDEAKPSGESEAQVVETAEGLSSNGLTKKQAAIVLKLVDDICGDTWCEGDRNFHFDQIECTRPCAKTPGTCRLAFRMFPYGSDLATGPTYARACKTPDFAGFTSLVDTAPSGYQSLNWQYYDALSACISAVESKLPPV